MVYFSSPSSSREGCVVVTFLISPSSRGQGDAVGLLWPWTRFFSYSVLAAWHRAVGLHLSHPGITQMEGAWPLHDIDTLWPFGADHSHPTATEHWVQHWTEKLSNSLQAECYKPNISPQLPLPEVLGPRLTSHAPHTQPEPGKPRPLCGYDSNCLSGSFCKLSFVFCLKKQTQTYMSF